MSNAPALTTRGLTRRFGPVRAVDGVDLTVPAGEVLALLGPNGAGKTTLLDMALGFSPPSDGTVRVLGSEPVAAVRQGRVGAVLQTGGLLEDLSVRETVAMVAGCHRRHIGVPAALERAGLTGLADRRVKKCSGGERQRLRFALALLTDPELLILDEPTAGMDVRARHDFWDTMHAEADRGRTIVFATHFLPEAEDFADRIVLMREGRIHADGTPAELATGGSVTLTGRWAGGGDDPDAPARLAAALGLPHDAVQLEPQHLSPGRLRVRVPAGGSVTGDDVARHLLNERLVEDLSITHASLDDVFLSLTDAGQPAPSEPQESHS